MIRQFSIVFAIGFSILMLAFMAIDMKSAVLFLGIIGMGGVVLLFGAVRSLPHVYGVLYHLAADLQSLRARGAIVDKIRRESELVTINHPSGFAFSDRGQPWQVVTPPPRQEAPAGSMPEEPVDTGPEIAGPLLPVLAGLDRVLLIGGMGAGKTELLRWLAGEKVRGGHVVICDSHAAPDTWPDFAQVAGIGRNYPEIEATINAICNKLDWRYKQRASGARKVFDQITLIIDELFVLHQFLDLSHQFKSLLAESRKVRIGLIMAGQSDRANALGLAGNKDLVAGFEAVCYLERLPDGRRVGNVRMGGGKDGRYYLHPGPYPTTAGPSGGSGGGQGGRRTGPTPSNDPGPGGGGTPGWYTDIPTPHQNPHTGAGEAFSGGMSGVGVYALGYDPGAAPFVHEPPGRPDVVEVSDGRTAEIIRLARQGATITEICKRVFGHKGGRQAKRIRKIMEEHGI